jgi:hypothetical protein
MVLDFPTPSHQSEKYAFRKDLRRSWERLSIEPDYTERIPGYPAFRNSAASGGSVSFSE